jgi:hypothetical protein
LEEKENITQLIFRPQNRGQIHEPFKNNDNTYQSTLRDTLKGCRLWIESSDKKGRAISDPAFALIIFRNAYSPGKSHNRGAVVAFAKDIIKRRTIVALANARCKNK